MTPSVSTKSGERKLLFNTGFPANLFLMAVLIVTAAGSLLAFAFDFDLGRWTDLDGYFFHLQVCRLNAIQFFRGETDVFKQTISLDDEPVEVADLAVGGSP